MVKRTQLENCPFSYRETKDGAVHISYQNRVVTSLKGAAAGKFLSRVVSADEAQQQMVMAKATGHFKHGNEKGVKPR